MSEVSFHAGMKIFSQIDLPKWLSSAVTKDSEKYKTDNIS